MKNQYEHIKDNKGKTREGKEIVSLFELLPKDPFDCLLSMLSDKDIMNVFLISKFFHKQISLRLNSFYGRTFRFNIWQENELKRLERSVNKFKSHFQVTVLNRPHDSSCMKYVYYLALVFFALAQLLPICKYSFLIYTDTENKKELGNSFSSYLVIIMPIIALIVGGCSRIINAKIRNVEFQNSLITLNQFNELEQFIEDNKLVSDFILKHKIVVGVTTVSQLLNALAEEVTKNITLANELEASLEMKRFFTKDHLYETDLSEMNKSNPKLLKYVMHTNLLFFRKNNESLIAGLIDEKFEKSNPTLLIKDKESVHSTVQLN